MDVSIQSKNDVNGVVNNIYNSEYYLNIRALKLQIGEFYCPKSLQSGSTFESPIILHFGWKLQTIDEFSDSLSLRLVNLVNRTSQSSST